MQYIHEATQTPQKLAWKPREWMNVVNCSRAKVYDLIRSHRIQSVKLDGARLILTPPDEFLAGLPEG
jgi:hypothetical protein